MSLTLFSYRYPRLAFSLREGTKHPLP